MTTITNLLRYLLDLPKTLPNKLINILMDVATSLYIGSFIKDAAINILKAGSVPKHIALIMDGNRTYARKKKMELVEGHTAGAESMAEVLEVAYRVGVEQVTIYAFSIENFKRPQEEVNNLFALLRDRLRFLLENESKYVGVNELKIRIIGNRSMIPVDILRDLETIESNTANANTKRVLNVCFPYTTRDDITHAIRSITEQAQDGKIKSVDDITPKMLADNLYFGPDTPPLDILVRTSGHTRLSDFMMWQCASDCTIVFVDTLWPDFKFAATVKVLLMWNYHRTLQVQLELQLGVRPRPEQFEVLLSELPKPPRFGTVSN